MDLRYTLESIHDNWKPLFKKELTALHSALKSSLEDKVTPSVKDIFNAFIINPQDIKVIIVGQDPYPKQNDAHGLSFSTLNKTTPASLKNIFKCLNRLGYETNSNNLMCWLLQGVFLINTALTTEIGQTKKHSQFWFPFVSQIISGLTSLNKNKKMSILLWGSDAQKIEPFIKGKHNILKWTHPSPMADNQLIDDKKFVNCDNFDNLKNINWSTGNKFYFYTDGSGRPGENCASAVYIPNILKLSLLIQPMLYELVEENNIILLQTTKNTEKPPTTQRAEYLAIIYALLIAYRLGLSNVEIITDSRNAYGIIVEWTKRKEEKYENPDLVKIMRRLYSLTEKNVTMKHVLSHGKSESEYNEGNSIVDTIALEHFKKHKDYDIKIEFESTSFNMNFIDTSSSDV